MSVAILILQHPLFRPSGRRSAASAMKQGQSLQCCSMSRVSLLGPGSIIVIKLLALYENTRQYCKPTIHQCSTMVLQNHNDCWYLCHFTCTPSRQRCLIRYLVLVSSFRIATPVHVSRMIGGTREHWAHVLDFFVWRRRSSGPDSAGPAGAPISHFEGSPVQLRSLYVP